MVVTLVCLHRLNLLKSIIYNVLRVFYLVQRQKRKKSQRCQDAPTLHKLTSFCHLYKVISSETETVTYRHDPDMKRKDPIPVPQKIFYLQNHDSD